MKDHLEDYAAPDEEGYLDDNKCCHPDIESLLQSGILGFCTCGRPEVNLEYIRKGLDILDKSSSSSKEAIKHFQNSGAQYFFYYWADKEGLTEHGGSVPGWLTEKGKKVLQLLTEYPTAL